MATNDSRQGNPTSETSGGFRISNGPVVRSAQEERLIQIGELADLPKVYGGPMLFGIPRDPHTIFTYWNVDWSALFANQTPSDRQVYLRVRDANGETETEQPVEPMLGSHYVLVTQPRGVYQVEIGFYMPPGVWNSVASSQSVTMPPDASSALSDVDVATVPFHLSFQRMIDMFRTANGGTVASALSRLQARATSDGGADELSPSEIAILDAMNLSIADLETARREFADEQREALLRKRAEAILGFGSTSPSGGFGGSSWSSGPA